MPQGDFHYFLSIPRMAKLPYRFHSSAFIYEPYKHILTGDTTICNNDRVVSMVAKGANFRPFISKDITQVTREFRDALSSFCRRTAKKYKNSPHKLRAWKSKFTQVHKQICRAKSTMAKWAGMVREVE